MIQIDLRRNFRKKQGETLPTQGAIIVYFLLLWPGNYPKSKTQLGGKDRSRVRQWTLSLMGEQNSCVALGSLWKDGKGRSSRQQAQRIFSASSQSMLEWIMLCYTVNLDALMTLTAALIQSDRETSTWKEASSVVTPYSQSGRMLRNLLAVNMGTLNGEGERTPKSELRVQRPEPLQAPKGKGPQIRKSPYCQSEDW